MYCHACGIENLSQAKYCHACGTRLIKVSGNAYTGQVRGAFSRTRYAGFWVRTWATLIDSILILLITYPILISVYGIEYFLSQELVKGPIDLLTSWVLPAIAVIVFWMYKSATPGKMIFSARIVDAKTGGKPSTTQCVIRYFAYIVSILPLLLGFIWIAFDKRKQAWHDKLAGTVVVRPA